MAALIKQVLLDYAINNLSEDSRIDLMVTIDALVKEGSLYDIDLCVLNWYLCGYVLSEIQGFCQQKYQRDCMIEELQYRLEKTLEIIGKRSGYIDARVIKQFRKDLPATFIEAVCYLEQHGKKFTTHDVERMNI